MSRFVPIKPANWPQDTLEVPSGNGGMIPVGEQNRLSVRREFFVMSAKFSNISYDETQIQNIPTDQDGDFWMTDIVCGPTEVNDAFVRNNVFWASLQVMDLRTNYNLFTPSIQAHNLCKTAITPVFSTFTVSASTPIIQPYCFTRDGGVRLTLSMPAKAVARLRYDVFISLIGWKEYQYASR